MDTTPALHPPNHLRHPKPYPQGHAVAVLEPSGLALPAALRSVVRQWSASASSSSGGCVGDDMGGWQGWVPASSLCHHVCCTHAHVRLSE
jgi:hypothetical protein